MSTYKTSVPKNGITSKKEGHPSHLNTKTNKGGKILIHYSRMSLYMVLHLIKLQLISNTYYLVQRYR